VPTTSERNRAPTSNSLSDTSWCQLGRPPLDASLNLVPDPGKCDRTTDVGRLTGRCAPSYRHASWGLGVDTPEGQPVWGRGIRWVIAGTDRCDAASRLLGLANRRRRPGAQFREGDEGRAARMADRVRGAEGKRSPDQTTFAAMLMRTPLPLPTLRCGEPSAVPPMASSCLPLNACARPVHERAVGGWRDERPVRRDVSSSVAVLHPR
jgi:hypothetical protein